MCELTTILAITGAISTVAGAQGQAKMARQQIELQNEAAREQQDQINAQSSQKNFERSRAAIAERARMRVAAGEAGVAGTSVDALLLDSFMQEGIDKATIEYNRENSVTSVQQATKAKNTSVANTVPTGLEVGLAIAGQGASYEAQTGNLSKFSKNAAGLFKGPRKL